MYHDNSSSFELPAPTESLKLIGTQIQQSAARAGRDPSEVLLVGASKTVPASKLQTFLEAGLLCCGENYVQEGIAKQKILGAQFPDVKWHLIGALQSNKARDAVAHFDLIHGVDRASLVDALDKAARRIEKTQKILIQVNLGEEASKAGCSVEELPALVARCRAKEGLELRGLMCLPPFSENPERVRPHFRELRRLREEVLRESTFELSMGMSHDFEVAIEEGATIIRVGTALFGAR